ncbi:MAG: YggT family protein [Pseudonocardiales bacterium]|nr:MAG: YggT family protein [Pseudonocardiales bacterium]
MRTLFVVLYDLLWLFQLLLIARIVVVYVMMFARSWRPGRVVAIMLEVIFSTTDPPLKALARVIPPLRVGGITLDLSFLVLFIIVQILIIVVRRLAA